MSKKSPEYAVWQNVKQRCLNPNNPSYAYYGGRGIMVCQRWATSFDSFVADVGPRPSMSHTLDRKDNSKGYEPGNCRWATRVEQMNNMRSNRVVTIDGRSMTLAQAGRNGDLPVTPQTVANRVHSGWDLEDALATPKQHQRDRSPITWQVAENIRAEYKLGNISQEALASRYGVTQSVISNIVLSKRWVTAAIRREMAPIRACIDRKR